MGCAIVTYRLITGFNIEVQKMVSSLKRKFITAREIADLPYQGLTLRQIEHFIKAHFTGSKIKAAGNFNKNYYDRFELIDQLQAWCVAKYDLTTIKEIIKTTRWKQKQIRKPDITRMLRGEHMQGCVFRLGRMSEYHFNAVDFWTAINLHCAQSNERKRVAAEKARMKRDKQKFREMGDITLDRASKVKGTMFTNADVYFFESWNRRRPEKYQVDLNNFTIMGFKLRKFMGRYVTVNTKTDLSDLWYSSAECKEMCKTSGKNELVFHFVDLISLG